MILGGIVAILLGMAYDAYLAERVSFYLDAQHIRFESKKMMGGLCYLVDAKMLVGITDQQLMARVGPDFYELALAMDGVSEMNFTGKALSGFVYVSPDVLEDDDQIAFWLDQCLRYNPLAKRSPKKRKKAKLNSPVVSEPEVRT